jgi:flavin reductase (DIM6/NTAB) family NADH-FMN oxidoreductase RutF
MTNASTSDASDADTATFEELVGSFDGPMMIVTASNGRERSGCLVGFATQASIRPPRFLVMMSKANHTYGIARDAVALVVHVLHGGDEELATRFGELSGDDVDKFEGLEVLDGPGGAPVLVGVDWFGGRVLRTLDCGDHVGFLLAPHDGSARRVGEEMYGLQQAMDMEPGHPA